MALLVADDNHEEKHADGGAPAPSPPPPSNTQPDPEAGGPDESESGGRAGVYTDDVIASLVDVVLATYDKDEDGYVEYFEYKKYSGAVKGVNG